MHVLDSDAIQASFAMVSTGDDIVLVLRHGLLSAADVACLRGILGPVVARLSLDNTERLRGTG